MIWFVDSSALVKRYVKETGSVWLRSEIVKNEVLISQLTPVEISAALGRKYRRGVISKFVFYQARRILVYHLNGQQYKVINLSQRIVNEAFRLTFERSLRAYDAVQLASALIASARFDLSRFVFITADSDLEAAAQAEGFQTDNPLAH
ncbi:MAG: type II toxin-antitoxin system VapC family toxin [Acidobacteriota bacterium]